MPVRLGPFYLAHPIRSILTSYFPGSAPTAPPPNFSTANWLPRAYGNKPAADTTHLNARGLAVLRARAQISNADNSAEYLPADATGCGCNASKFSTDCFSSCKSLREAGMPPDVTLQPFNASTLCQLNSGSDNDGDDGGGKLDARCTRNIGCHCNTNMAGNKSSTVADSTRRDNNCSVSDKRNSHLGIQS